MRRESRDAGEASGDGGGGFVSAAETLVIERVGVVIRGPWKGAEPAKMSAIIPLSGRGGDLVVALGDLLLAKGYDGGFGSRRRATAGGGRIAPGDGRRDDAGEERRELDDWIGTFSRFDERGMGGGNGISPRRFGTICSWRKPLADAS